MPQAPLGERLALLIDTYDNLAGGLIDSFAVGANMGVAADVPYFDIAYKLVKYAGHPVMKLSTGRVTLVDKKQIWRSFDHNGLMSGDTISQREETLPSLEDSRAYFSQQYALLPEAYKALENPPQYPVTLSRGLAERQARVSAALQRRESGEI